MWELAIFQFPRIPFGRTWLGREMLLTITLDSLLPPPCDKEQRSVGYSDRGGRRVEKSWEHPYTVAHLTAAPRDE
jgi:hypothetical protein